MVAQNPPGYDEREARLIRLQPHLQGRVIGQDAAVAMFSEAVKAGEWGLTPSNRPKSFALVLGPTGTGKTKVVIESSQYLCGTKSYLRINCADFQAPERVPLLLGTSAGDPGLFGAKYKEMKAAGGRMILLDEIEKGHRSVSDLFLGMEAAELTLANYETLDLSGDHIFVTSNVASAELSELDESVPQTTVKRVVESAAKEVFRPEVFGRFTHVIIYRKLSRDAQLAICRQMLEEEVALQSAVLTKQFGHPHEIKVGDGVLRRLVSEGYHPDLGARPMRNVVERRVRTAIINTRESQELSAGVMASSLVLRGDEIQLRVNRGRMRLL